MDSRVLDANSEALGVPVSGLMDAAGKAVSSFLETNYPGSNILFVCGPGNNGGDGFAAALNMDPERVSVALLKKPSEIHSDIARERYSLLECPIQMYSKDLLSKATVIVDCALGTGSVGKIREPYRSFIEDCRDTTSTIVSVDIPSGLGSDIFISPKHTLTFHDVKTGMSEENCGEIIICDIGIPDDASRIVGPGDMLRYPLPSTGSHKGDNGRLMIVAGGPYYGAPAMSTMAALRTGADIVRLFAPESIANIVASYSPVPMITQLPGDHITEESVDMLLSESNNYDAVLVGPGIGRDPQTVSAVRSFIERCKTPLVVDADGLSCLPDHIDAPSVLTPHKGEYMRNWEDADPMTVSAMVGSTLVLKGKEDIITDGSTIRVNRTGNASMTGAGTGDVLSGIIAALMSKGMTPFDAASVGTYICGKAGDYAFEQKSYGTIATDIIDMVPMVLKNTLG